MENAAPRPAVPITLRHVEVFWAVMTAGSVTEAAALLSTSQPTVSRELARFEHLTRLTLFDRVRGRLRPTAQGLALFDEVRRAYFGLERIADAASAIRQFEQGQLAVVCLPALLQSFLPAVCRDFLADHGSVGLNLTPQESPLLEEWLSAQRYDIGLTEGEKPPPGTRKEALLAVDEVCVLPPGHALASKPVLLPSDFAGQPFLSLGVTDPYRQQLDQVFLQAGIERRMVMETHSAAALCAMALQGIGVAVVNPLTALDYAKQGLQIRRFAVSIPFIVNLVRPDHRPSSVLVDRFADAARKQAADISRQLKQHHLTG